MDELDYTDYDDFEDEESLNPVEVRSQLLSEDFDIVDAQDEDDYNDEPLYDENGFGYFE